MIPYGKQHIDQTDIDAVLEVLKSDYLTQGPKVPEFESKLAEYVGAKYAVAVNSGTSALHVACRALDLGVGDWLWTSPVTFVASANCGLYCGARVDFVEIDRQTGNLCPKALEAKLIEAEHNESLPKVVVAVHLCGEPCDMQAIGDLSRRFGFHVIEDASHALGGQFQGEPVGTGRYSDITVFSFHPVKNITTAEGGAAVTNQQSLAETMTLLRGHGITRDPARMTQAPDGPWYYQQIDLGFNYRMTDLQAALGMSQLKRLNDFIVRRRELAAGYDEMLAGLPIALPVRNGQSQSGLHLYVVRLEVAKIAKTHLEVFESLREQGIGVNLHYVPVHTQPYYQAMGFRSDDYPEAMRYYREAITLPLFVDMTDHQQAEVVCAIKKALRVAGE